MARKNRQTPRSAPLPPRRKPSRREPAPLPKHGQPTRESIESIVIAFVLAFLFRTFVAEAFVIPTGSMAPTLMGQHKDINCTECGERFRVNASIQELSEQNKEELLRGGRNPAEPLQQQETVAGMCPTCRYTMPLRTDLLRPGMPERNAPRHNEPSYSGDRILVNKYAYSFTDPERWDVIVFKYPGNAQTNYIKRLVGLPKEELRIYQGDIHVKNPTGDFEIVHKSPEKVLAMRQRVHDTQHDSSDLRRAGWPLRWVPEIVEGNPSWQVRETASEGSIQLAYHIEADASHVSWFRYRHTPAGYEAWQASHQSGKPLTERVPSPELITDYNAYNSAIQVRDLMRRDDRRLRHLHVPHSSEGLHWVGDLIVEAELAIESDSGELHLDLVEGGQHFTCSFDLASGEASLDLGEKGKIGPKARTRVRGQGRHKLRFANVDDQLHLWVDGALVAFDQPTTYDVDALYGQREQIVPRTGEDDPGDLAPVGIGARGARIEVTRLSLWRDIYYIADRRLLSDPPKSRELPVVDYPAFFQFFETKQEVAIDIDGVATPLWKMRRDPSLWAGFFERRKQDFYLGDQQLLVLGDNSAASLDCRLWSGGNGRDGGFPGGPYLEKSLLIGKAVCVYWPHSWGRLPGTPIPFPLFPNFGDMRLVR